MTEKYPILPWSGRTPRTWQAAVLPVALGRGTVTQI